ncbi:hypothetical protein Ddye_012726 [Dipteronia dyeriana]|uniref:Zinc knuckle CX2CX4HX4C domain-containing protein n=1 Tax=Dipteronia dyeriana TaxID=168575 RepID=A0AAE0CIY3_9ROSI|nr:hypothetical protein Ddye_012726 [Dipteronia dyeriana]
MARGIEIPLKFDRATLEDDYGHFARMLIDVDLSKPLPDSIMIEVGDDCLFLTLLFENVPSFCSVCCSIGHSAVSCHHATRFTRNITVEPNDKILERGRSKIRQEYRPKHKSRDVPTSRVFETIKSGIDVIVTKPVTSPLYKTTLDPTTSSSSLRPIIPNGHGEALKNDVYLDDSTDPLHTEHVDIDTTSYLVIANMEALIDPPRVEPHLHNPEGEASSDTDSEGTESDFSHPITLHIAGVQEGVSWVDQSEDSGWNEVTTKKGLDFIGSNARSTPSIWIFGSTAFQNATIVLSHSQHVTISATFYGNVHRISFIYASVNYITLRSLWSSLIDIAGSDIPWHVPKDFNSVLGDHETTGNISTISCDDFRVALTVHDPSGFKGMIGSEGFSDDLFHPETATLADLDSALKQQEIFLKEKKIGEHVSSFYQHLFSDPVNISSDLSIIREHVPSLVTVDENTSIFRVPYFDELRNKVFTMDPECSWS